MMNSSRPPDACWTRCSASTSARVGWKDILLTGRHGLFNSYEAFIRIVDSMFSQHAKWLKVTSELPWRRKIASLNYLLASHVWQQDHNGFTHQDPGFLDHVINKKADIVRVYLPPDANCLLSVFDHCLRSRHYVNVVVAGKHALPQWLTMDDAVVHCTEGIGIWQWASNDQGAEPDVVMACCGDTPTLEILAAVSILREHLPDLKIRVINVVDLMKLQPSERAPARAERNGLRFALHEGQAHHLWLPRISLAGPPADLPPDQPQPARPGLQGRGHDHDGLRHAGAERSGPLPSGARRGRSAAAVGRQGRLPEAADAGQAYRAQAVHRPARPGHAGNPQLEVGHPPMNSQELINTAGTLVADDKGLLAMDESNPTCNKRFARLGIPQTEEARRAYRELIVTTPGLGECISGAILYDETIRQQKKDGTPFVKVLTDAGIIPGIKVDTGAKGLGRSSGRKGHRGSGWIACPPPEYSRMGARFAKWRAVIAIGDGIPSRGCIDANAQALARYAAMCQEAGLVPIVEPEVLMDGSIICSDVLK